MSTKSNTISIKRAPSAPNGGKYFVVCLSNDGYEASLEPRKFYVAIRDRDAEAHDQLRIIDESGEDYLFPASYFAVAQLEMNFRRRLFAAG